MSMEASLSSIKTSLAALVVVSAVFLVFPAWVRFLVPLSMCGAGNRVCRSFERSLSTTRVKSYECHGLVSAAKMKSCSTIFMHYNMR